MSEAKPVARYTLLALAAVVGIGGLVVALGIYDGGGVDEDSFDRSQREMFAFMVAIVGFIGAVILGISSEGFSGEKAQKSKVKCYGCGAKRRFDQPCPSCGRPP